MYEAGKGVGPILTGGIVLPNTGGNTILTFAAIASIVIGSAILLSTLVRLMAKKAYIKA
jgi:LPXTG-motif cell wall-anchored protein